MKRQVDARQKPRRVEKAGQTPLHYASASGYDDVTRLLREHGARE
jgi:ankyrin repeat protein